ncbi:MAG: hypothetical protein ACREOC_17735 [Gemmatimonadales bacterium]
MIRAAAAVVGVVGCVHVEATRLSPDRRDRPTCAAAVTIYTAEGGVGRPYRTIAYLNASGGGVWTSEEDMVLTLRDQAAELGANGLILGQVYEPGAVVKVAAELFGPGVDREGTAAAIYIAEDSARTRAACRGHVTPP